MERTPIGFDFETDRIAAQNIWPEIVCGTFSCDDILDGYSHAEESLLATVEALLDDESMLLVAHNASFDLGVLCRTWPHLLPKAWKAVADDQRVHCTIIREKLLNLTTHGGIEFAPLPGGETMSVRYGLSDLVKRYFDEDISAQKDDDDTWRTNYSELRGLPFSKYPEDAASYALADARYAERIWHLQEERRQEVISKTGTVDPFATLEFRVAADFALGFITAHGMATDADEFDRVKAMLAEALKPENVALLVEQGILRPEEPPRPHAKGHKDEDGNIKMTKGKAESVNEARMREYMIEMKDRFPEDVSLRRTKPSKKFPKGQLSFDSEWLDDHWHLDPVIEQFRDRQMLRKLVTTDLPRLCDVGPDGEHLESAAPVVHACFDVLKRTGRTSSYASKKYPSLNCQNVDPRARGILVARPGYALVSLDYSQMELGTLAQTCLNLFGTSVMAEKINEGTDLHAFLGGAIAYNSDDGFRSICDEAAVQSIDDIYRCFSALKKSEVEEAQAFFKHYRTLAKPTGLGYPGGLGVKTFMAYAKKTYGVIVDRDTATLLRNVWLATFPEMEAYFEFIDEKCVDPRNSPRTFKYVDDDGEEKTKDATVYAYETPYGMYRAGTDFCAAANGIGLQSPSAEGAVTAVVNAVRACYDPSLGSLLYDDALGYTCRVVAFIHDELLCEVRLDEHLHERVEALREIMVESMRIVTPDVAVRVEAKAMLRWDKKAEAMLDENGRLAVWEPAA